MTEKEFSELQPGDLVQCVNWHDAYDAHFGVGDILKVRSTALGQLHFEPCPRQKKQFCKRACEGNWALIQNFAVIQRISPEELSKADVMKPVDPEELKSFFM